MRLDLGVCDIAAQQAGVSGLWKDIRDNSTTAEVHVYKDKASVKVQMAGADKKLVVVRNGHGDYRLRGDELRALTPQDKVFFRALGAKEENLCKIGEAFIKYYRAQARLEEKAHKHSHKHSHKH
jgi:hypothetical protein